MLSLEERERKSHRRITNPSEKILLKKKDNKYLLSFCGFFFLLWQGFRGSLEAYFLFFFFCGSWRVHVCASACAHAFFVYGASSQLLCYFIHVIEQFLIKLSLARARSLSLSLSLSFTQQPQIPGILENSRSRQNSCSFTMTPWTWGRT